MNQIIKSGILSLLLALFIFSSGCDSSRVYETYQDFDDQGWPVDSVARFDFKIDDPEQRYNVYFNLRNNSSFPTTRLFVKYTMKASNGELMDSSLLNHDLFHPKTGVPYGSGLGDVFDHQFPVKENYAFDSIGTYSVFLEQFSREELLQGVLAVGVRVEKVTTQ